MRTRRKTGGNTTAIALAFLFAWAIASLSGALLSSAISKEGDRALCKAILEGQTITLWYRLGEGPRTVLPRFLGYTRAGNLILGSWQISGFSESGKLPGFRNFRMDRVTKITITNETTEVPSGRPP